MTDFKLPDLGEGVHEGRIVRVLVKAGDIVREDQPLMEVETDKASVEIPSPLGGSIGQVHVVDGQLVHVGDVMVSFGAGTEPALARSAGAADSATGAPEAPRTTRNPPAIAAQPRAEMRRIPASPAVRKRARELGIKLDSIDGSGPAGRVSMDDLTSAQTAGVAPAPSPFTAAPRVPAILDSGDRAGVQGLSQARKTIAATMAQSWSTIPHVTDCEDADITDLDRLRKGYAWPPPGPGQTAAEERKLTILAFVIRAVAMALQRHPVFNSSYDPQAQEIIHHSSIHVAVGVQTERGLIAPILRDADRLSVAGIAEALVDLSHKVREGKFAVNELRGGTYTISNAGAMGGSRYSTPLITPPQVAVLALGRTRWQPWVIEGAVVPRYILPLSHSFDHRIIDGSQEIAFQQDIIGGLENPARLML